MTFADQLPVTLPYRYALAAGLLVAMVAALIVTPRAIRKLLGANITGQDMAKPDKPVIPEMGGIAVFLAFNAGAFTTLALAKLSSNQHAVVLASLVVAAGACVTGVLDDLVELRQRFKAFIPFAFAAPLAFFVPNYVITFPVVGAVDFGWAYPFLLLPLGVACAANGFNMLEGFNGLGAGLGIILGSALSLIATMNGTLTGLVLLFPLVGALGGFLWFNAYPARVFPGDTMTLLVGAVLAAGAILSKIEFWGALLFAPHIIEFLLKMASHFKAESFASRIENGRLHYEGRIRSLTHPFMRRFAPTEVRLVTWLWLCEAAYAGLVIALYVASRPGGFFF